MWFPERVKIRMLRRGNGAGFWERRMRRNRRYGSNEIGAFYSIGIYEKNIKHSSNNLSLIRDQFGATVLIRHHLFGPEDMERQLLVLKPPVHPFVSCPDQHTRPRHAHAKCLLLHPYLAQVPKHIHHVRIHQKRPPNNNKQLPQSFHGFQQLTSFLPRRHVPRDFNFGLQLSTGIALERFSTPKLPVQCQRADGREAARQSCGAEIKKCVVLPQRERVPRIENGDRFGVPVSISGRFVRLLCASHTPADMSLGDSVSLSSEHQCNNPALANRNLHHQHPHPATDEAGVRGRGRLQSCIHRQRVPRS
jgi:hypothetical protein